VIDLEEDPMQAVLLTEEQAEVHRAFEVLRPDEREALELFYVEGMSPTQIAEMTGKSTVAVRASLNEALVKVGVALRTLQVDATTYPRECREIYLPRLPAYLNGRLESPELEETLRHLEGCQHCQAAREEMRETERRLRSFVPPVRMPPNLFRRIETALEATRSRDGVAALAIDSAEGRPAAPAASVGSVGSVGARLPLAQLRARLEVQVLESLRRVQMALSSGWGTVAANPGVSGAVAGAVALAVTAAVLVPRGHPPPPGPGGSPSPSPSGSRPSASPSQPVLAASVQASNHAVPGPPPPGPTASGPIAPRPTAAGPRASSSTAPGPTPSQTLAQELLPVPAIPSSNWPQWRHDAAHSGFDPADKVTLTNGRHLTTVWSTLIGPDTPYPQRQDAGMIGSPVFADGFVYAGPADG